MSLSIQIVVPPPRDISNGNWRTARRWSAMLRELGHRVTVQGTYTRRRADLCVALHATKSLSAMQQFRADHPENPIFVALTGTDIYGERSLDSAFELSSRIIALQPEAKRKVPRRFQRQTVVLRQSAEALRRPPQKPKRRFQVSVIGHLRAVKDPFRTAMAARLVPPESKLSVVHVGRALTDSMEARAQRENERNPRYCWVGGVTASKAARVLARSHLTVISSRVEGSSNVLSEALVNGVPVLASRISGLTATLGARYPGCFPYGDTHALGELLWRVESDPRFRDRLVAWGEKRKVLVSREQELDGWKRLLTPWN